MIPPSFPQTSRQSSINEYHDDDESSSINLNHQTLLDQISIKKKNSSQQDQEFIPVIKFTAV